MVTPEAVSQRTLEKAHYKWAIGLSAEAQKLAMEAVKTLNDCLSKVHVHDTNAAQRLRPVCEAAIELYQRVKANEKLSLSERLLWLASSQDGGVDDIIRPPVPSTDAPLFIEVDTPLPDSQLPLSEHQQSLLESWRPIESGDWTLRGVDEIYQDYLQDCSFVTAFISLARNNGSELLESVLPHGPSARYGALLHFNGSRRLVQVSNELPFLQSPERSLFIRSHTNTDLLWPAILEKAYLTLKGHGYDSVGSNAGIDTYIISGWFPTFVTQSQVQRSMDDLWDQLYSPFQENKLVLAVGTGSYSDDPFEPNHDYAIVEMDPETRTVLIKNPWREKRDETLAFSELFSHFETLYVNHNPATYHHNTFTGMWHNPTQTLYHTPQVHIQNKGDTEAEVQILVEKHINFTPSVINVNVFRSNGERLFSRNVPMVTKQTSPANNTGFHFSSVVLAPGESCTAVISNDFRSTQNFTLHTYCTSKDIDISKALPKFPALKSIEGSWDVDSCGGNWSYQSYMHNPQYELAIPEFHRDVSLELGLFSKVEDTLVNVQLYWWDDSRPFTEGAPSLINEKYQQGSVTSLVQLTPDQKYKLVVSTYEPDVHGDFQLVLNCDVPLTIQKINTRLGLFVTPFTFNWGGKNRFKIKLRTQRRAEIRIHLWSAAAYAEYRPKIRASLFYADDAAPVQVNPEFDGSLYGIWLDKVCVDARDVTLLVERFEAGNDTVFGEIGSDVKVNLCE